MVRHQVAAADVLVILPCAIFPGIRQSEKPEGFYKAPQRLERKMQDGKKSQTNIVAHPSQQVHRPNLHSSSQ